MADKIQVTDVQGIILHGYELLKFARFALLEIGAVASARPWLASIADRLTSSEQKPGEDGAPAFAINIAFTVAGLDKLGVGESLWDEAPEFREGMDTDHRQLVLGDTGPEEDVFESQKPVYWLWGNRAQAKYIHILLMVYAGAENVLKEQYDALKAAWSQAGLGLVREFEPLHLRGRTEHFGFRDGAGQPGIEGCKELPEATSNVIKAGEVLLGYPNEYGKMPPSPVLQQPDKGPPFDFGRNGSYLVFRQLQQNVPALWHYILGATQRDHPSEAEHFKACVELAAKMVGRWPRGSPLATNAEAEPAPAARPDTDPQSHDFDRFLYEDDPLGLKTPLGCHIRRSNPRDSLEPGPHGKERLSVADSLHVTRLHRIIRRGRPYGDPLVASMDLQEMLKRVAAMSPEEIGHPPSDDTGRGLLFLCFNANIARQFEFIQQTWINNPKFVALYQDSDPLMGQRHPSEMNESADVFTVQAKPVRRRYTGLSPFVRVRGGGYFFMPGIAAVKYLAGLLVSTPSATS